MSEQVRLQARQPEHSYLVQAPAGAGKTELLTQRILALLGVVDEPEEILALTFTRKAAAEMRMRVIEALTMAQPGAASAHKQETWRLAQQALQRSEARGWNLLQHPARLQMMTLDSFMYSLAQQLPLLSGLGQMPAPTEHADVLYRQAAELAVQEAWRDYPEAAECVLLHQDHQTVAVISLLADMLSRREQWLGQVAGHARDMSGLRRQLEQNLDNIVCQHLQYCDALLPVALKTSLLPLFRFAGSQSGNDVLQHLDCWPAASVEGLPVWKQMAALLLTTQGALRKSVTKQQGFPAGKQHAEAKAQFVAALAELDAIPGMAEAWHELRLLPASCRMDDAQWQVLESLFILLILANRHLQQCFAAGGEADFTEIALRAMAALGEHEAPGELLMRLDCRIRHVLVDEFQDTSHLQLQLLQSLTSGWQAADGGARSLFMVGDPMQSIYRFRKADVGLFLSAARNELALPQVRAVRLERNFRSAPAIVQWVNRAFARIFPPISDAASGAVQHASAAAALNHDGSVHLYLQHGRDAAHEAAEVVALVRQELARPSCRNAPQRIGILARSRKHLHAVIPALREAGIAFRAIAILPLKEQPEIRLLRALLRALLHPLDRMSWAALLRAPCCGLTTLDMHRLLSGNDGPVWALIEERMHSEAFDEDVRKRLQFLQQALAPCMMMHGRVHVHRLLDVAWQRLALNTMFDQTAQLNVQAALRLIESLEQGGRIDFALLDDRLDQLYAEPDMSDEAARVELLTMHGAKGLQWDAVILPGLGCSGSNTDSPLIAFSEVPLADGNVMPLLAVRAPTRASDALYDLVRRVEKRKDHYELQRLLYVACTRAQSRLHLLGHVSEKTGKAEKGSLLSLLLAQDEQAFGAHLHPISEHESGSPAGARPLYRMAQIPPLPAMPETLGDEQETEYVWAGIEAAPVGNAMHVALQKMAETGMERWTQEDTDHVMRLMRRVLLRDGLSGRMLDAAMQRCKQGMARILDSERARWILSRQHTSAFQEWALTSVHEGRVSMHVIDRSFIDSEGVRWIIDYKTAQHEGGELATFIDEEERRYRAQLQRYAAIVKKLEPEREIRTALYFPMLDVWREVGGLASHMAIISIMDYNDR